MSKRVDASFDHLHERHLLDHSPVDPQTNLLEVEEHVGLIDHLLKLGQALSHYEFSIVILRLAGLQYRVIAHLLGRRSVPATRQAMHKAVCKLRTAAVQ